jgi:hypothetical protein
MEAYSGKQFVGIDLHRRRSVIVRTTEGEEVLETVRIVNDVERLASVMARAGECPEGGVGGHLRLVLGSMRCRLSPASATPKTAGSLSQGWTPNEHGAASASAACDPWSESKASASSTGASWTHGCSHPPMASRSMPSMRPGTELSF